MLHNSWQRCTAPRHYFYSLPQRAQEVTAKCRTALYSTGEHWIGSTSSSRNADRPPSIPTVIPTQGLLCGLFEMKNCGCLPAGAYQHTSRTAAFGQRCLQRRNRGWAILLDGLLAEIPPLLCRALPGWVNSPIARAILPRMDASFMFVVLNASAQTDVAKDTSNHAYDSSNSCISNMDRQPLISIYVGTHPGM
jgi:hypothetical protein